MADTPYQATLSRGQGRSAWSIIFRHPVRRDSIGKVGRRVRRGLGTNDELEAQRLVDQMNAVLSDPALWTPGSRDIASRRFDRRIVAAFYDDMVPEARDFWSDRERVIPLPGPADGYARTLLVGTTGAGKTTLVRQLIGTHPKTERFPSTSAAKTTIADLEIVLADGPFRAVVTFLPRDQVQSYIEECVQDAALAYYQNRRGDEVKRRLLENKLQRFRLSYLLGTQIDAVDGVIRASEIEDEEDLEEVDEQDNQESGLTLEERELLAARLRLYVSTIQNLATRARQDVEAELGANPTTEKEQDALDELVEERLTELDEFRELVDTIVDDVETRFDLLQAGTLHRDESGWPAYWTVRMADRDEFIRTINRFSSNYAPQFGRLLTPLVQGIRVAGPFQPEWIVGRMPKLVLMDGEGLGHTPETASSLPTDITRRFDVADAILLVDSAPQPMQAAPSGVLRSILASGHEEKLIVCFTHFDDVRGDNLRGFEDKRDHVLGSLHNAVDGLSRDFGQRATSVLEGSLLEDRTIFLSNIQKVVSDKARRTREELTKLVTTIEESIIPPVPTEVTPVYDDADLVLSISRAVKDFHEPWQARLGLTIHSGIVAEHWTRIKALTRRPAEFRKGEYDTLRPVADLIQELSEHISIFLQSPMEWVPEGAPDIVRQAAVNRVSRAVYSRLHRFASVRLIGDDTVTAWQEAFGRRGYGSARLRARDITEIYDAAAPVVDEPLSKAARAFISDVRELVREAIREGGGRLAYEAGQAIETAASVHQASQ